MKKGVAIYDLLFYLILPYLIWKYGRDPLGDYYALLLSTAPGFLFSVYRFFVMKQFNITGLFLISTLLAGSLVDLLSGSAERMLWNQVYFGLFMGGVYLVSILIRKPLVLYFAVDIAALRGMDRQHSFQLFGSKEILKYIELFTLLFVVNYCFGSGLKSYLILEYGVENYDKILLFMRVKNWIFSGINILAFILVSKRITEIVTKRSKTMEREVENEWR